VSWSASTDNAGGSGVASYAIYRDGVLSGTVAA
jgi:chitinase